MSPCIASRPLLPKAIRVLNLDQVQTAFYASVNSSGAHPLPPGQPQGICSRCQSRGSLRKQPSFFAPGLSGKRNATRAGSEEGRLFSQASPGDGALANFIAARGLSISIPQSDPQALDTRVFERWMSLSGIEGRGLCQRLACPSGTRETCRCF